MAQTDDQMSAVNAKIEVSANGSVWTDISGHANKVTVPKQNRATGSKKTFDGDIEVITYGKREKLTVTVDVLYTEEAADAFEVVRALHETENGADIYLRWSPKGGSGGNFQYSTGKAKLKAFQYPSVDSSSADPMMTSFDVETGSITKSAVAT